MNSFVEEKVVHYYDVILGKIPCGSDSHTDENTYSVFPESVTCPDCLKEIAKKTNAGSNGARVRSAA